MRYTGCGSKHELCIGNKTFFLKVYGLYYEVGVHRRKMLKGAANGYAGNNL